MITVEHESRANEEELGRLIEGDTFTFDGEYYLVVLLDNLDGEEEGAVYVNLKTGRTILSLEETTTVHRLDLVMRVKE